MTYCVGIINRDGLLMIADTRTNAGLDNIATFRKLHVFRVPGEKTFVLATAGNLGFTQSVISILREGWSARRVAWSALSIRTACSRPRNSWAR